MRKITAILAFLALSVYGVNAQAQMTLTPKPAAMPASAMAVMAVKAPQPAVKAPAAMPAPAMSAVPVMATAAAMRPAAAPTMQPAMSAAPVGKKDSVKKVIIGGLLEILLYVVGSFLAVLLPILSAWIYRKFKVENMASKDAIDKIVNKAVQMGLGYAEEKARKLGDSPEKSALKKKEAIAAANKYLRDSGLAEKGSEYLGMLIEAKLGASRNNEPKLTSRPADSSIPDCASNR